MVFKKNAKKAQAAIEFLMTYGWMLLVVLIVGALIFSFVDFGNLLPNAVDFQSTSLRGDPEASAAYSADVAAPLTNIVQVAFTFTGQNRGSINTTNIAILNDIGESCTPQLVSNDATGADSGTTPNVPFLNGQIGTLEFDCTDLSGPGTGLIEGDSYQGEVTVNVVDSKRGRAFPNKGTIRLSVQ